MELEFTKRKMVKVMMENGNILLFYHNFIYFIRKHLNF